MHRVFHGIGRGLWGVLKVVGKAVILLLRLVLGGLQVILVLFSLVLRVFCSFVRAGTP